MGFKLKWQNLRRGNCPKCNNPIRQRKLPSNPYASLSHGSGTRDDPMYGCYTGGCTFSIRRSSIDTILKKMAQPRLK